MNLFRFAVCAALLAAAFLCASAPAHAGNDPTWICKVTLQRSTEATVTGQGRSGHQAGDVLHRSFLKGWVVVGREGNKTTRSINPL